MNKQTKRISIILSCIFVLLGIIAAPRVSAYVFFVLGNSNNSSNVTTNFDTNYIVNDNIENYTDGTVGFITGNITGDALVQQAPIHISNLKEHTKPTTPSTPTPAQPANNTVPASSSSSSTSTTSSGAVSGGPVWVMGAFAHHLFLTGGSYWFFIASIGNILMMLLGGYLRLRSGRSPGYAYLVK